MLASGANVNALDSGGNSALMNAAFKGYTDIASYLIAAGAKVNARHGSGLTILMLAVIAVKNNMVELLLANGADAALTDHEGKTAFDLAREHGNPEALAQLLLKPAAR